METKVFKKYLFNLIAITLLVLGIFLLCENSLAQTVFNVEGYFNKEDIGSIITNGFVNPIKVLSVYSLFVYAVPIIFVLIFIVLFFNMFIRKRPVTLWYILTFAILTLCFTFAGILFYTVFVEAESGAFYIDVFNKFKDAALFRNVDLKAINFEDGAQVKAALRVIGYDLTIWLVVIFLLCSVISYLEVCYAFCSKSNRVLEVKLKNANNQAPINYYYVSNYYTHPDARQPDKTTIIPVNKNGVSLTSKDVKKAKKKEKDYYYPKIK